MNCVFSKNAMRKKRWKSHKKYFGIPSLYKINYPEKIIFFIIYLLYLKFIKLPRKWPSEKFIQKNKLCKRMLGKLIYKIIRRKSYGIY